MSNCFQREYVARDYLRYRPTYSSEVAEKIVAYLEEKLPAKWQFAIDVGCGSGQFTRHLAPHFAEVLGVDISKAQIETAKSAENPDNVSYRMGRAESLPAPDSSVSLITSATASHYFDWVAYEKEVDRALKPGGCVVVISYDLIYLSHPDADVERKLKECVLQYADYRAGTLLGESTPDAYYTSQKMEKELLPISYTEQELLIVDCRQPTTVAEFIACYKTYANFVLFRDDHPNTSRFEEFEKSIMGILQDHSGEIDLKADDARVTAVYPVTIHIARKPTSSDDQDV